MRKTTLIVDGEETTSGEFAFRRDGRIISEMEHIKDDFGKVTIIIKTAPPISHLPHAWTERASHL